MKLAYLAFTEQGMSLANKISKNLGGQVSRCGEDISLRQWTKDKFETCEALVFVGAVGIAVRAISPYMTGKDKDPAVVVIDELGKFSISLLSGHLGGANKLASKIGEITGAQPVITTATDINGHFSVDTWSGSVDAKVQEVQRIKNVSSKVLRGEKIKIYSPWDILGKMPEDVQLSSRDECDVCLDVKVYEGDSEKMLHLIPEIGILGVGCRRNISINQLEEAFEEFIQITGASPKSIRQVVSIDLKKDEIALKMFCQQRNWDFNTYTSEALNSVEGNFNESDFVKDITGVGSVCERSVVCAGGILIDEKFAHSGVTFAFGVKEYKPLWCSEGK